MDFNEFPEKNYEKFQIPGKKVNQGITNSNRMRSKVESGSFEENGKFSLISNQKWLRSQFLLSKGSS